MFPTVTMRFDLNSQLSTSVVGRSFPILNFLPFQMLVLTLLNFQDRTNQFKMTPSSIIKLTTKLKLNTI